MTVPAPLADRLDRRGELPLWEQLRLDLLSRIEGGEFAGRFPGELALSQSYGVSRHTVREALRGLREGGVLQWSRGRVSRANPGTVTQPLGAMYSLFRELERRGIEQRSVTRRLEVVHDPEIASRLDADDDALVLVERVRLADDEPLALDRVWLPAALGRGLLDVDLSHTGLYDAWFELAGIRLTGGRECIRADLATTAEQEGLGVASGSAVLRIEREGRRGEEVLEVRHTVVRGDRFAFTARWGEGASYTVEVDGPPPGPSEPVERA